MLIMYEILANSYSVLLLSILIDSIVKDGKFALTAYYLLPDGTIVASTPLYQRCLLSVLSTSQNLLD